MRGQAGDGVIQLGYAPLFDDEPFCRQYASVSAIAAIAAFAAAAAAAFAAAAAAAAAALPARTVEQRERRTGASTALQWCVPSAPWEGAEVLLVLGRGLAQ